MTALPTTAAEFKDWLKTQNLTGELAELAKYIMGDFKIESKLREEVNPQALAAIRKDRADFFAAVAAD